MRRRVRRTALVVTAVVIVAIAGGVTYAVAEIGGGGEPIGTTPSGTVQSLLARSG
jgi:hypothetical protein